MANYNRVPADERFWRFVTAGAPEDCWEWKGGRAGKGYGQFYIGKLQPIGAHRFSWSLHNTQQIPDGKHVLHTCDNPPCVNPAHLWIGTSSDNHWDQSRKGRNPGNRVGPYGRPRTLDVAQLQAMRAAGLTYRQMGRAFGVSEATVWRNLNA